jgi:hypothetical protein
VERFCNRTAPRRAFATLPNNIGFVKPMTRSGAGAKKPKDSVQLLRLMGIEDV